MKHDITAMLRQFSAESSVEEENVDQGQVGAEEILVVTDETTTELEEAIEQVAETVEGQEAVGASLDAAAGAVESLESAVASLVSARLNGERVTATAIRFWAQGIESSFEARGIPEEAYRELTQDFSESHESDNYSDYSVEAENKAEGVFAKLWAMIKSAFARARDFMTRLIAWFGKSADSIIKAGRKLKEAVKGKTALKDDKAKVSGAAYGELTLGGTEIKAINAVKNGRVVFETVDKGATAMYESAVVVGKGLKTGSISVIPDVGVADIAKLDGTAIGGKTIKAEGKTGGSWYNNGKLIMKFSIEAANTSPAKEQTVMSPSDIATLADELIKLGESVKSRSDDAKRTQGKLSIEFPKDDDGKHIDKMKERREAASAISSLIAVSGQVRGKVAQVVLATGKKAYVYGMANVRMYK